METIHFSETSVVVYESVWCNIPKYLNFLHICYENAITLMVNKYVLEEGVASILRIC
jgi:hypothetical protein